MERKAVDFNHRSSKTAFAQRLLPKIPLPGCVYCPLLKKIQGRRWQSRAAFDHRSKSAVRRNQDASEIFSAHVPVCLAASQAQNPPIPGERSIAGLVESKIDFG